MRGVEDRKQWQWRVGFSGVKNVGDGVATFFFVGWGVEAHAVRDVGDAVYSKSGECGDGG